MDFATAGKLVARPDNKHERAEWLAERASGIGASESPAILGQGFKGCNAWTVWARKTGVKLADDDDDENELLRAGRISQPMILAELSHRTGYEVRDLGDYTIQRHPRLPFMLATLDAVANMDGEIAVVEAKNVSERAAHEWERGRDRNRKTCEITGLPPLRVQIQLQHQLAVTGLELGIAVAWLGGHRLGWIRQERDQAFIEWLEERLTEFWALVTSGVPPEVDGSEATSAVLKALHPQDDGGSVSLPDEAVQWDLSLIEHKAKKAEAEKVIDECENRIKAAIGKSTYGELPNGVTYSWKHQNRRAHWVEATTTRVLRKQRNGT